MGHGLSYISRGVPVASVDAIVTSTSTSPARRRRRRHVAAVAAVAAAADQPALDALIFLASSDQLAVFLLVDVRADGLYHESAGA